MVAIFVGDSALLIGMLIMFLPLLVTELSRPRDGVWGALIVFFGLVLINGKDQFQGSQILAVVSACLLMVRLGIEVAQSRWHQLSEDEKLSLSSKKRWTTSFWQLQSSMQRLLGNLLNGIKFFWPNTKLTKPEKKWIRPEEQLPVDSLGHDKELVVQPSLEEKQTKGVKIGFEPESPLETPEAS